MNERDTKEARAIVEEFGIGKGDLDYAAAIIQALDERGISRSQSFVATDSWTPEKVELKNSEGVVIAVGQGDTIEEATHVAVRNALSSEFAERRGSIT